MQMLNISETKARLSAVVERVVKTGEEFLIGRAGKPVARIVRYEPARKHRRLGFFSGQVKLKKNWDKWPEDIAKVLGISE